MKRLLIPAIFFTFNICSAQKLAEVNYKDSCLITGGIIKMTDLGKICKVCPKGAKKVSGFIFSYTQNPPLYLEQIYSGNRWDPKFLKKYAKPGLTFMIEEIQAFGADGKRLPVNRFTIGFK